MPHNPSIVTFQSRTITSRELKSIAFGVSAESAAAAVALVCYRAKKFVYEPTQIIVAQNETKLYGFEYSKDIDDALKNSNDLLEAFRYIYVAYSIHLHEILNRVNKLSDQEYVSNKNQCKLFNSIVNLIVTSPSLLFGLGVELLDHVAKTHKNIRFDGRTWHFTLLKEGEDHAFKDYLFPGYGIIEQLIEILNPIKMQNFLAVLRINLLQKAQMEAQELQGTIKSPNSLATVKASVANNEVNAELAKPKTPPPPLTFTATNAQQVTVTPLATIVAEPVNVDEIVEIKLQRAVAIIEQKFEGVLQEVRFSLVDLVAKHCSTANLPTDQSTNLRQQIDQIFRVASAANHRSLNAEKMATDAILAIRQCNQSVADTNKRVDSRLNAHERYLHNVIVTVNKLGPAFAILSAKVAKMGERETIRTALKSEGHLMALRFFDSFISEFETKAITAKIAKEKQFKFDYGRKGIIIDTLVSLAQLVPINGVGGAANAVKSVIEHFETSKIIAASKKVISCTGSIAEIDKLACAIAIAVLKFNGDRFITLSEDQIDKVVDACIYSAFKYITKNQAAPNIYAEDIAYSILAGEEMQNVDRFIRSQIIAIVDGQLLDSRHEHGTRNERDWLNKVLESHGRNIDATCEFAEIPVQQLADLSTDGSNVTRIASRKLG